MMIHKICKKFQNVTGHFMLILAAMLVVSALPCPAHEPPAGENILSRESLREDLQQLLCILDQSHPDPYLHAGGRIAFHRHYNKIWEDIPPTGWTQEYFHQRLMPLLASIGDSHTALLPLSSVRDGAGLPFIFKVVEQELFVTGVSHHSLTGCLGAQVKAIAGLTLGELLKRQARLRGCENPYTRMLFLIFRSLNGIRGLQTLIPEWAPDQPLTLSLELAGGEFEEISLKLPLETEPPCYLPSGITLPSGNGAEFSWGFVNGGHETALLLISGMDGYRERFEYLKAAGYQNIETEALEAYKRFNADEAPRAWDDLLAKIPSAGECFADMVRALKKQNSRNLIIDLRQNSGGSSIMSDILIYMLFGEQAALHQIEGYSIIKDSPLLRTQYKRQALSPPDGYDFLREDHYRAHQHEVSTLEGRGWNTMPSFWKLIECGNFKEKQLNGIRILVLSSPSTYSSGFNLLTALKSMGAETIGTPSAQAPNNFGDALAFTLGKSGLKGYVSFKQILTYPDDPAIGTLLPVDHPLTVARYLGFGRDPNSEVLLALEMVGRGREE